MPQRYAFAAMLLATSFGLASGLIPSRSPRSQRRRLGPRVHMNVWSNPQAVEDYQNLLNGIVPTVYTDRASCFVLGSGSASTEEAKLGKWLMSLNVRGDDVAVDGPTSDIPATLKWDDPDGADVELSSFPIYMCVGADELEEAIDAIPEDKRDDLIFLTDGFIEPILKKRALCGQDQTQCVFYVTVNENGVGFDQRLSLGPVGAQGLPEFAAETTVTGKWAGAVEQRVTLTNTFFCRTMFYRDWRRVMLEKVAFLTVFPLVGSLHPKEDGSPSSLADVADFFDTEADDMLYEMGRTLRGHLAVTLLGGYVGRMMAYAQAEHSKTPAVVQEWRWRNGPWYELSQQALSRGWPDTSEMHTEYLEYGKLKGMIECKGFTD